MKEAIARCQSSAAPWAERVWGAGYVGGESSNRVQSDGGEGVAYEGGAVGEDEDAGEAGAHGAWFTSLGGGCFADSFFRSRAPKRGGVCSKSRWKTMRIA